MTHEPSGTDAQKIVFRPKRFFCRDCHRVFTQPLPGIGKGNRTTDAVREFVVTHTVELWSPQAEVARRTSLTTTKIRNIIRGYGEKLDHERPFHTPRVLAIDGVKVCGRNAFVVTDAVRHRNALDVETKDALLLFPDQGKSLKELLRKAIDFSEVQIVTIDMDSGLRSLMRLLAPHALIVADPFHVLSKADDAVQRVRRDLGLEVDKTDKKCPYYLLAWHQKKLVKKELWSHLDSYFKLYPKLALAYECKEMFYQVRYSSGIESGRRKLHRWIESIPEPIRYAFKPLVQTLTQWGEEFLNNIIFHYSNGRCEALNGRLKELRRRGRNLKERTIVILFRHGLRLKREAQVASERRKLPLRKHSLLLPYDEKTVRAITSAFRRTRKRYRRRSSTTSKFSREDAVIREVHRQLCLF